MPTTYSYKWQRTPNNGVTVTDIPGTTGLFINSAPFTVDENYALAAADVGDKVRIRVTDGTTVWEGPWSATITAAPAPGASSIYWGAWIDGPDTYGSGFSNAPWDSNTWNKFEADANKTVSIIHFGQPNWQFNQGPHDDCWARGAAPFVDFSGPQSLVDIANGVYDSQITAWATNYKNYGKPTFIRWGWEANQYGSHWFPWAVPYYWTPTQYVNAWVHMKNIADAVGADNMTWVWCPNFITNDASRVSGITAIYPFANPPDWLSFDGYNDSAPSRDFDTLYQLTYDTLTGIDNTLPIIIGEFASRDASVLPAGTKASWITEALTTKLAGGSYPNIKAAVWFNWKIPESGIIKDWPIESSPGAQTAFKNAIASSYFKSKFLSTPPFGKMPIPT